MEDQEILNENPAPKRPVFLTVLCILTFISAGLGGLSELLTPLYSDVMIDFLKSNPKYDEAAMGETIAMLHAGWGFYFTVFVLSCGSFTGAFLMWKLKKIGFHFYSLSNLAILFVPMLMMGTAISWAGILLTASFIALYALNLKYMK